MIGRISAMALSAKQGDPGSGQKNSGLFRDELGPNHSRVYRGHECWDYVSYYRQIVFIFS